MTEKKLNKKLEEDLFSARTEIVIDALNVLKKEGNIAYLPILFDMLNAGAEQKVEDEIKKILGTLKVRESAPVLVHALTDPRYKSIRKTIATACWQNGLDYREHLPVFVDLVIQEEWETSFEAFTVIDNMKETPAKEISNQVVDQIHTALKDADDQKKYFLNEILAMIR